MEHRDTQYPISGQFLPSIHPYIHLCTLPSTYHLPIYPFTYGLLHPSNHAPIYLCTLPSFLPSIHPSIHPKKKKNQPSVLLGSHILGIQKQIRNRLPGEAHSAMLMKAAGHFPWESRDIWIEEEAGELGLSSTLRYYLF